MGRPVAYRGFVPAGEGSQWTIETVAVLFTDMVDSTALASRLSPETADEIRRGHFSILRQAVAEWGGTEVKNLGDGLMVVFNSASVAMACAVAMQQGVERGNRRSVETIGLRVGLSGGEVSKEDGDYFGDPVIEAARLCARCDRGQILAAAMVRLTAGRRNRHECIPMGSLSLKGLPDPVETVEVVWEPLTGTPSGSIPLPGRLAIRPEVGVVGREAEAMSIAEALQTDHRRRAERSAAHLGRGRPGQDDRRRRRGAGRLRPGGLHPLRPLRGGCRRPLPTLRRSPRPLRGPRTGRTTPGPYRGTWFRAGCTGAGLGQPDPRAPPSRATDSDSERYLLFAAVVGLLSQVSRDEAVVLVFDDLQWADRGSLQLLSHLVASELPMRLMVLATYRDTELSYATRWSRPWAPSAARAACPASS